MRKFIALLLSAAMLAMSGAAVPVSAEEASEVSDRESIEYTLNLKNNPDQTWTYSASADAWTLSVVSAVTKPILPDQQGVSVCVPGAYVKGIDTDADGEADVLAADGENGVQGSLVIDYDATVTSTNGQVYTAETAPVILNTGAAGYSSSTNTLASSTYAAEGYINVACGNRGKQDSITAEDGTVTYVGDAPSCLVDQKNAARYVKYNILLGNLPGSVDRLISTGGSGGGAHATMFALTSNSPDFYPYEADCGAVGVYRNADGTYTTTVTVNGAEVALSDGAWGCIAYSAITSLAEADMCMAFEYYLDTGYSFGSSFQKQLAAKLSEAYMDYINDQNLTIAESSVGFDLDGDGALNSIVALTIQCDPDLYPETNGYHGTYLDLYLDEFTSNLQWYLDNLDYASGWTWFDADGNALSDEAVAAMTTAGKAQAFLEGRCAAASAGGRGGMGGGMPGGMGGKLPDGQKPDGLPDGTAPGDLKGQTGTEGTGDKMLVGTPDQGTTQAAGSSVDSANYATYDEMLAAYEADIAELEAGDACGNNLVSLYNPLNYIGAEGTENPAWVRIMMGASEGDMSMFSSLNLEIALLNAGVDANIEWQWNGGHVPSEILGQSFSLYVDQMVAAHGEGSVTDIEKAAAVPQTANGTASSATGTDITSWVSVDENGKVSFSLAAAAAYRTAGASKAIPGFDVFDYGQEDYVFGDADSDARHWDSYLLKVLQENADVLAPLFNAD